jgi:uncharacterized membrane protein
METIILPPARPASSSETSLWLHNPTSAASTDIEISVTGFISQKGATIPAAIVRASPRRIDRLDASTSREVRLRVDIPRDQPAGMYFGLVLLSDSPGDAISLLLNVGPSEEASS